MWYITVEGDDNLIVKIDRCDSCMKSFKQNELEIFEGRNIILQLCKCCHEDFTIAENYISERLKVIKGQKE